MLSPRLSDLKDFPYSAHEQRKEALIRATKMSIQGVQPKLSVILKVNNQVFIPTNRGGRYILKPQHDTYPHLPENESLTMRMAQAAGMEVPVHGLIYCVDGTLSYVVRRFDRTGRGSKLAVEDFAQLMGYDRGTKYNFSMEKLVDVLESFCTFPMIEKVKLFKRSLFNFLVGNEDMHLKNFSLITRAGKVELAPIYDFLSTTVAFLALGKPLQDIKEVALPLRGKKKNLTASMWVDYYGRDRLEINEKVVTQVLRSLSAAIEPWIRLISVSFLPDSMKVLYEEILRQRCARLCLGEV